MASESYLALLRDPLWQRKRLEIFQRDGWKCQCCDEATQTLNVHHRYYLAGHKPWEYEDDCLLTLCEDCHAKVTEQTRRLKEALRGLHEMELERVIGYIEGIVAGRNGSLVISDFGYAEGVAASIGVVVADEIIAAAPEPGTKVDLRPFFDAHVRRSRAIRQGEI